MIKNKIQMITISGDEIYLVQAEDVTQQNDWCATGQLAVE